MIIAAIITIYAHLMKISGNKSNNKSSDKNELGCESSWEDVGCFDQLSKEMISCDSDSDCICCDKIIGRNYWNNRMYANRNYLEKNNFDCLLNELSNSFCKRQYNKCENNNCVTPKREITVATDKTEYKQGETIKITFFNGLDYSIHGNIWTILKYQDGKTINLPFQEISLCNCKKYHDGNCSIETKQCDEIQSMETYTLAWSQKIPLKTAKENPSLIDISFGEYQISSGEYQMGLYYRTSETSGGTTYSNKFIIKENE